MNTVESDYLISWRYDLQDRSYPIIQTLMVIYTVRTYMDFHDHEHMKAEPFRSNYLWLSNNCCAHKKRRQSNCFFSFGNGEDLFFEKKLRSFRYICEMENQKISGLLEDGFTMAKLRQTQNQCDKTLEEKDSGLFSNLSEKCTVDVYGETARKISIRKIGESRGCEGVTGNNQGRKISLDSVTNSNEFNDIRMSVLEGNLEFSGENEVYVENVVIREAVDQGNDTLQLHESNSPTKIEVSGKGINLFVDLLCSQDGIYEGRDNVNNTGEHIVRGNDLDQDNRAKGNGTLPSEDVANASAKIEGDNDGKQQYEFGVGDMVWVKTPNQLWWPGMIRDPSNAAKDTENFEGTGCLLVKYFGNVNSLWCNHSNLKPFLEYFEQMLMQNNSSIFLGSVEKALSEIGWRVKAEMTCPCFLKGSQKIDAQCSVESREVNSMSKGKMGKSDVLSLSQFEPSSFLACAKHLAQVGSLPGKIELTIIKNRLSAFYSSVGHCQLTLLQLRPPIGDTLQNAEDWLTSQLTDKGCNNASEGNRNFVQNDNDDFTPSKLGNRNHNDDAEAVLDGKTTSSGKGHESRERKKSKYLSYPYVDVNQGLKTVVENGTEGPKQVSGPSSKPTPASKCSDKNTQKKATRKPFKGSHKISKSDDVNASSAELLAELSLTALDGFYPKKSKHSDSLKIFYCSFRQFTFLNHEKLQNCPEADIIPRKAKKKKEGVKSAGVKATNDSFGKSTNSITNNSSVIGCEETGSDVPRKGKTSKKRMKAGATPELPQETGSDVPRKEKTYKKRKKAGATPELPQVNMIDGLLDLNGNNPSFSVEKMPFSGTSSPKGKLVPKRKKEGLASPNKNAVDLVDENINSFTTAPELKDVQATVQSNSQLNNGAGLKDDAKFTDAVSTAQESEVNMKNAGLGFSIQTSLHGDPLQSDFQPERKKRKRKANTGPVSSPIPDLNGDVSEPGSLGKDTSELNAAPPNGKPEPKRRRRNKSDISGSNVNINKMSKKEEDFGAILLLNFAPGFPPPSKETLIPIFSRFGLLKESETQVLNDSMAQIVYERKSDGGFACRSLEKSNPFGASLINFNIKFLPGASQTIEEQNSVQTPRPFAPAKARKTLVKPREAPDLIAMRENVEKMKSVLEKAGDSLLPEMRTKLENEIKSFLNKISTMGGSSSS
ncbi:Uncharacterized protein Adt_28310 [Abeliophyllum distichum]|uniref:PWWP domain-containing protein n=1 Tax=Abeliophyllum distichum TaxID=126358 RepID=A0ABD1RYE9_9LAMI